MSKTIKLKKYSDVIEEYVANAAITPGNLVELRSDGKVQNHAQEDKNVLPMFALEDELQGKTIADNYAQHDPVQVWIPYRGDQVYARLKANENVVIGDQLVSAGDGTLKKYDAAVHSATDDVYGDKVVAQALVASDESTVQRIAVRIA